MERKEERINLAFESVGSEDARGVTGEKPPILLLHGLTNVKETWRKLMRPIAESTGRKVYAYDARNHGDSSWSGNMSYEAMRDDLLKFLEGLHARTVVLIGHSMGGKTAMYFALKWPDRVEKLVVEDISPKATTVDIRGGALRYVQSLRHILEQIPEHVKDLPEAKEFVSKRISDLYRSGNSNGMDNSILPLTQDKNGKFRWKTNLDAIENTFLNRSASSAAKGPYKGPALFLWGTKSPYNITNDRKFILERFPRARFRAVQEASHEIHQFHEDLFLHEVTLFINEAK